MRTPKRRRGNFKARKCTLQNVYSGCTVTTKSISAFARKLHLSKGVEHHIPAVLTGKSWHAGGWFRPKTLKQRLSLKDVFGNRYETTVMDVLRRRKLSNHAVKRVLSGRTFQGLVPADKDLSHILPPRSYRATSYVLQDSTGETFEGASLREVAERAGIKLCSAFNLVHGYQDVVKGVYLKRVKTEPRRALAIQPT